MKRCPICGVDKPILEFGVLKRYGRTGTQGYCIACFRVRRHEQYMLNSDAVKARARNRERGLRQMLREWKSRPCSDCGVEYPYYVMDFDHREGVEKSGILSKMVLRGASAEKLRAEADKCDVVCANCHRARTFSRMSV